MNRRLKAPSAGSTMRGSLFGLACLCFLGLTAFLGASAPSVGAAETFPGEGFLPNDRAWEMVSPPDKNGGDVYPASSRTRAAADGNAVQFISPAGFAHSSGMTVLGEYIAERTAAPGTPGWATHGILPKQPSISLVGLAQGAFPLYQGEMSPDLSRGIYMAQTQLPGYEAPSAANVPNLYLRDDLRESGPGSYQLLSEPFALTPATPFPASPFVAGSSTSFSKVAFESRAKLTEDAQENDIRKLYESEGGVLRLAGRIPASGSECDDEVGPSCEAAPSSQAGVGAEGESGLHHRTLHMVSADGSRVFFQAPVNTGGQPHDIGSVYMREDGRRTVKLNASEKDVPEAEQGAILYDASASGDRVFFVTGEGLVEQDEDNAQDIYMAEPDAPAGERLTLVTVDGEPTAVADDVSEVAGASEDGRYLYFMMGGQLVAGEPVQVNGVTVEGLYLWHEGEISFIGRFAGAGEYRENGPLTANWFLPGQILKARVSPDGRHLLFTTFENSSGFEGRGGFSGYEQNEKRQQLLYSAETGKLRCATCNFGTLPTAHAEINTHANEVVGGAVALTSHVSHALSDDGRFVFFNTPEALVDEDINGRIDAYQYDSTTEEIDLLSSGTSGADSWFLDASANGRDVFIATREPLSGWDTDTSYDLYDARIGGGLPEPVPPPPSCQGDACQPAPAVLNDPTPASSSYAGPGSSAGRPKARCPKGRHRVRAKKGRTRCVKAKRKRAAERRRRAGK